MKIFCDKFNKEFLCRWTYYFSVLKDFGVLRFTKRIPVGGF